MPDPTPPEPSPSAPVIPETTPTGEVTPAAPEPTPGEGDQADKRDAEIAELKRQIEAAAPVLKAHADAEEASKSELQKAQDRAAQLESDLAASREAASRATVAAKTGLAPEIVALLNGADEASLLAAAEQIKSAAGPQPPNLRQKPAPKVGAAGSAASGEGDISDPAKLAAAIRAHMPY